MPPPLHSCYRRALREPAVWRRAGRLGLVVGLIQVSINQGDHWVRNEITKLVLLKSACSVLVAILVVLLASASTRAEAIQTSSSREKS
ncbi:MAG: hypothetical protein ABIO94_11150 [Opitutaceae bacterium]